MWAPKRPSFWDSAEERDSSRFSSSASPASSASASATTLSSLQSRERSSEGKRATQQTEGGETEEAGKAEEKVEDGETKKVEKRGAERGPGGFESDEERKETPAAATRDSREEERVFAAARFSGEEGKTGSDRRDAGRRREEQDGAAPVFSVSFFSEEVSRKSDFSEESANPRCSAGALRMGGDGDDEKAKREEEALAALSPLGQEIFFAVRGIRDPEFPVYTLGDLGVTTPEMICMQNEETLRTGDREAEQDEREGRASEEEAGAGCREERSVCRGTTEAASVRMSSRKRENSLSDEFQRQPPAQPPHASSSSSGHVSSSSSSSRVCGSFASSPAVVKVGLVPTNAKCSMNLCRSRVSKREVSKVLKTPPRGAVVDTDVSALFRIVQ
ncbi:hypothetical protein TGGT1_209070 [Toxoplasma gondii GT1]|uniref:Uncharacterized protein n=6 Tax=Toxoplasma gondii TaxID=5811 RepID=S7UJK5_TOXGG|nr:hypothetical protein TGGT1_209070 [Toxoplasma gondii GT1]KAF4645927.1 hypothetical protein TGRH88_022030 [Toxoplasma gondii]